MSRLESFASETHEARHDAADTLSLASSAVKPAKAGLGEKVALASIAYRLVKRYPIPTLVIGGIALAYYLTRRHATTSLTRH